MTWISVEVDDGLMIFFCNVLLVVHAKRNRADVLDSNISAALVDSGIQSEKNICEYNVLKFCFHHLWRNKIYCNLGKELDEILDPTTTRFHQI